MRVTPLLFTDILTPFTEFKSNKITFLLTFYNSDFGDVDGPYSYNSNFLKVDFSLLQLHEEVYH